MSLNNPSLKTQQAVLPYMQFADTNSTDDKLYIYTYNRSAINQLIYYIYL